MMGCTGNCAKLGLAVCLCAVLNLTWPRQERQERAQDEHHMPMIDFPTATVPVSGTGVTQTYALSYISGAPDLQIHNTVADGHFDARPVPRSLYEMRSDPPWPHRVTGPTPDGASTTTFTFPPSSKV